MTPQEFRAAREALGYSRTQLALLWGMPATSHRTVAKWESGERPLNPIAAFAMLTMLGESTRPSADL